MSLPTLKYSIFSTHILALLSGLLFSATSLADITATPPWNADTRAGLYNITLAPQHGSVRINALQNWVVTVRDAKGGALSSAGVFIDGGMRAHGHGLPTQPQVSEHLGDGRYLVEGMRLNMIGAWTLVIGVEHRGKRDTATFNIEIDY